MVLFCFLLGLQAYQLKLEYDTEFFSDKPFFLNPHVPTTKSVHRMLKKKLKARGEEKKAVDPFIAEYAKAILTLMKEKDANRSLFTATITPPRIHSVVDAPKTFMSFKVSLLFSYFLSFFPLSSFLLNSLFSFFRLELSPTAN